MSGGYWDYGQFRINSIVEDIEESLEEVDGLTEVNDYEGLERDLKILKNHLELASIYMCRLDWLLSGDDGNESYNSRLREELNTYFEDKLKE